MSRRTKVSIVCVAMVGAGSLVAAAAFAGPSRTSAKHRPPAAETPSAAPGPSTSAPSPKPVNGPEAARANYGERRAVLEKQRTGLGASFDAAKSDRGRADALARARTTILDALEVDLFPAWLGTRWDFNGTTENPGEGAIACGYFVTTILSHAGFHVARAKLAQQASENIVKTLVDSDEIWRFRKGDKSIVLEKVHELGEGLYVVGLDNHVGFLFEHGGGDARFCHASYLDPGAVTCERAEDADALESNYHVLGRVTNDATLTRWLEGDAFETVER